MKARVNIGCGLMPLNGWHNYDNSLSIRLAKKRLLMVILDKLHLLTNLQREFISFAKTSNINWADAGKHIPEPDNSVEVLYSCHMLEHLTKEEAEMFLKEARRILQYDGIIRIVVPNIKYYVDNYLNNGDANNFIEKTLLTRKKPKTLIEKLRYLIIGDRDHQWMYDGNSICEFLTTVGFKDAHIVEAGSTMIPEPGDLDLMERFEESVFVEAINS